MSKEPSYFELEKKELEETEWNKPTAYYVLGALGRAYELHQITLDELKELKKLIPLTDAETEILNY